MKKNVRTSSSMFFFKLWNMGAADYPSGEIFGGNVEVLISGLNMRQTDIKRLVTNSSVVHMGLVLRG